MPKIANIRFIVFVYLLMVELLLSCNKAGQKNLSLDRPDVKPSFFSVAQPMATDQTNICYTVVKDPDGSVNIRSSPNIEDGNLLQTLANGTTLTVIEQRADNWLKISMPLRGWVHESRTSQVCNSQLKSKLQKLVIQKRELSDLTHSTRLKEEQFHQLSTLQGMHISSEIAGIGIFKIALPTYIPDGFEVIEFKVNKSRMPGYSVIYRNKENQCFKYMSWVPGAGSPSSDNPPFEVQSVGLGRILVKYIEYDQASDQYLIETEERMIAGQGYYFSSPAGLNDVSKAKCNPISKKEAIKIIESIDYVF